MQPGSFDLYYDVLQHPVINGANVIARNTVELTIIPVAIQIVMNQRFQNRGNTEYVGFILRLAEHLPMSLSCSG